MKTGKCPIIIIGSSTGGPQVLERIFSRVPRLTAAVIIVQHLSSTFVPMLCTHIHQACNVPVIIPTQGETILPGKIYIAPAGRHMRLSRELSCTFSDTEKIHGVRPSIDVTMQSVCPGNETMGILLTGMGEDGAQGIMHIKKLGGTTIVQDPATCAIRSMPLAAIATGGVEGVLTPDAIADRISAFGEKKSAVKKKRYPEERVRESG